MFEKSEREKEEKCTILKIGDDFFFFFCTLIYYSFPIRKHGVNNHFGNLNSKNPPLFLAQTFYESENEVGSGSVSREGASRHCLKQSMYKRLPYSAVCWLLNTKKCAAV